MNHTDLDRLLRIDPPVRPLDDARSEFYFNNRDLIETWAALRVDASAQLAERLIDLGDQLEADLADLDPEPVIVERQRLSGHGRIAVMHETWAATNSEVSIGIEWETKPINTRGDVRVYACVRLPSKPARPVSDIDTLTDQLRTAMPGWTSTRPQWPVWRYTKPAAITIEAIVSEARRDFLRLWTNTHHIVDQWAINRPPHSGDPAITL